MLKDMIPIFLLPLLGFLSMEQIQKMLMVNSNTYKDTVIDVDMLTAIALSEGYVKKAYLLSGESRNTIGLGTTYLYNADGSLFRGNGAIKSGETLSSLKQIMFMSNYSDFDFAMELAKRHMNKSKSFKYFSIAARYLDKNKIPYNKYLAGALIDFNYNSGGAFSGPDFASFLIDISKNPSDKLLLAKAYFKARYNYIRSLGAWNRNAHGWLIRLYYHFTIIRDSSYNHSVRNQFGRDTSAGRQLMIKKVREEIGLNIIY